MRVTKLTIYPQSISQVVSNLTTITAAIQVWHVRPPQLASVRLHVCMCYLIDIGVLLAELPFVLHNGLQVRKTASDLQESRVNYINHNATEVQTEYANKPYTQLHS